MRHAVPIFLLVLIWTATLAARAAESPAGQPAPISKEGLELFEKHIRPVLAQYCYECHSTQAKKIKGKLLLDSHQGLVKGGANGAVTTSDYTGTLRLEGLTPKGGGNYRFDFSSIRSTTNNQFAALNPQYPAALTLTFTQPLLRGFRFDQPRRQIAIAKKNLSLTDAQFRQRTIETITNVQRAYWDLVFALRNLQIQRDAVRDAPNDHCVARERTTGRRFGRAPGRAQLLSAGPDPATRVERGVAGAAPSTAARALATSSSIATMIRAVSSRRAAEL